jgi:uncharacterized phiE125 gp8 family phage protein
MALQLATEPTVEPITVAEAVSFLKTDVGEDNNLLDSMLKAVRQMAEQETGRSLMTQTWRKTIDRSHAPTRRARAARSASTGRRSSRSPR